MNESYIEDVNLRGFLVVQSELFRKEHSPIMCLFNDSISFNKECHICLNNCESIQILMNMDTRTMIVRPASSSEQNTIVWRKDHLKETYIPRINCPALTRQLFSKWGLEKHLHLKTTGRLVQSERKLMLLFDFNTADTYEGARIMRNL